ncbi:MAG: hypothetical protein ABSG82_07775, partial [Sedimentisphaerales bacterium]
MKSKTEKTYRMERAAEGINASFGKIAVVCLALVLGLASASYGLVIGNWESPDNNDGWVPGSDDPHAQLVPDSPIGVTLGHGSLQVTPVNVGAYWVLRWETHSIPDLTDANLQFDLTMKASDWPDPCWTKVCGKVAINSDGPSGWKEYGPDAPNNKITVINRDTGGDANFDWQSSEGDANKTYIVNVSDYDSTGATWFQINVSIQGGNGAGHFYFDNARVVTPYMIIRKCTVTAGKTQGQDAFSASGTLNIPADLNDLNDIDEIDVNITSLADEEVIYSEPLAFHVVKNKYTYKIPSGRTSGIT